MDTFAVAVCTGLGLGKPTLRSALTVGGYFGGFQAAMPFAGYLLAYRFANFVDAVAHWIAFGLLWFIGGRMILVSVGKKNCPDGGGVSLSPSSMIPAALATSVDALAVGGTFAFLGVQILPAVSVIGALTLVVSAFGVWVGCVAGVNFKSKAEFAGGFILCIMAARILLQ